MREILSYEELTELEKIALETADLPLCQRIMAFVKFWKWYPTDFFLHTELDANTYSKLKNDRLKKPDTRTVVAMCVGLRLPFTIVEDLLQKAGMAFSNSQDDRAYRYIVMMMNGATIEECNKTLRSKGVALLGSIKDDYIYA